MNTLQILLSCAVLCVFTENISAETLQIHAHVLQLSPDSRVGNVAMTIHDGTITRIAPAKGKKPDLTGQFVTQGFIEAGSRLGLGEVLLVNNTVDGSFSAQGSAQSSAQNSTRQNSNYASFRVADSFQTSSQRLGVARKQGITTIIATPRGGLFSGRSAIYSNSQTPRLVVETAAMYTTLGHGVIGHSDGSRGIAIQSVRQALNETKEYLANQNRFFTNRLYPLQTSRANIEALSSLFTKKMPLVIRANRLSDIKAAAAIHKDFGIRVAIEGGAESWKMADTLAKANIPVIIDPAHNLPNSFDAILLPKDLPMRLHKKGVHLIFSTVGSWPFNGTLRQLAGIAIARGLPWKEALRAITQTPANLFELPASKAITEGQPANFVIWSGDPFLMSSYPIAIFIDGKQQSLTTRQDLLFDRYR